AAIAKDQQSFSYAPSAKNNIYYRLKVMSVTDQIMYSNVIVLKINDAEKTFKVSTTVHSEITVNASENYKYNVADMNGRIIKTGSGKQGINSIEISNNPNGIYI